MNGSTSGENCTSKVRFGVFEFNPRERELKKHGTRLKVQDQPLQILTALLEQPGQIVSREDLQRRLWPDGTFVDFEQSLNKAVNKLREALGDSADHPVYIETLARRGYRFLAPLEREEAAKPVVAAAVPGRRLWPWLAGAGAVLAVVLGTGLWPIDVPQVERVVRLTSDASNKNAPFVVDGNRVLYSDGKDIWSVSVSGGDVRRVPLPFLPQHRSAIDLAYASLARQQILLLAYSGNALGELWLAGLDGEAPRKVGELRDPYQARVALAPNADRIAVSLPDGVYIQSIETGERTRILSMKWKEPSDLWWHPSGRSVGFLDYPGNYSDLRAWQVNDNGAHLRRIVPEKEHWQWAGAWSPDGKRFFYYSPDLGGEIFVRTQPGIHGWMRKPVVTKLTASGEIMGWPAVDPVDPRRLYVRGGTWRGETMRYDRAGRKWVSFLAGFSGDCIDWSPDGQWMTYVKYPGSKLHKSRIDGSGDVVLASGVSAINPHWSPDGKRIAFAGRPADAQGNPKLWLVSAGGGDAAPYRPEIESGYDAIWSGDGKKMLLAQADRIMAPGESRLKILELKTGEVEQVPGGERIVSTRWSPDGKQVCGLGDGGLHVYDLARRRWRELIKGEFSFPTWSSDSKYIYGRWIQGGMIGRVEVATGRIEEIVRPDFPITGDFGVWVGWTKDWDPLVLRDFSSVQIYRIDLDR